MTPLTKWQKLVRRIWDKKFWCKIGVHQWVADMTKYYNENEQIDFSIEPKEEDVFCDRCGKSYAEETTK